MAFQRVDDDKTPRTTPDGTDQPTSAAKSGAEKAPASAKAGTFKPTSRGRRKAAKSVDTSAAADTGAEHATSGAGNGAAAEPQGTPEAGAADPDTNAPPLDATTSAAAPGAVIPLRQRDGSAQIRVDRLKAEVNALADRHAALGGQVTALAIRCEEGDETARAERRTLRAEIAALVDEISDKKAALAAAEPIAAIERHHQLVEIRSRTFDQARTYLGYWEGWAEQADRCVTHLIEAIGHMRSCESAVATCAQPHVPQSVMWLLGITPQQIQNTLTGRLVRNGILGTENDPGPMWRGDETLRALIAQHAAGIDARLDDIERRDRDPAEAALAPEQPKLPWETAGGKPWRSVIEPVITDTNPHSAA